MEDQASQHLLVKVPTAQLTESVGGIRKRLFSRRKNWECVSYVYVLDTNGKLRGVASLKELLAAPLKQKMGAFRRRQMATVRMHSPVTVAVARSLKHNIRTVPIVDENNKFLGMLSSNVVQKALEEQHVRELFIHSGVNPTKRFSEIFEAKIGEVFRWRFPWLFSGLVGGLILTVIMRGFHESIEEVIALAFFVPMTVYMADAVGTQTQTLYIRGIAFGAISAKRYLFREFQIDVMIGIVSGLVTGLFALYFTGSALIAAIVAVAMLIVVATAGAVAVLIAALFKRFTRDPAFGGGPLTTVIQDALTIIIYFAVATVGLSLYG